MSNLQSHNTSPSNHQIKINPVISRIFKKRELDKTGIEEFLSWDLKKLPDLTSMLDTKKTALRIVEALENNEEICIHGDYDVDGTTSCALFYQFFQLLNKKVIISQPSRHVEGYGLHNSSLDFAKEQNAKVVITVDCGITNVLEAQYAKELGIDLIITDHHTDQVDKPSPDAYAIVNPNRRDEPADSPLRTMAGVGVAFAVALQVKNELEAKGQTVPSIYPLLQYVAIGTICDLAKLTPVNLKMVRHGLRQLKTTTYPGLNVFLTPEEKSADHIPSEKLSFFIGPMINSKGRLDHPEMALKLLISTTHEEARSYFSHLEISNNERKFIQSEVYNEAKNQIIEELKTDEVVCSIAYGPHWHEGVIGIVASKLVETFNAPAIVLCASEHDGVLKASARSAGDLNLFEELTKCTHLFEKFGGHKAAAGFSIREENLKEFKTIFQNNVQKVPAIVRTNQDYYEVEIAPEEVTPTLVKELDLLEPFGMGNPKPVFKLRNFKLVSFDLLKEVHVRWNISSTKGHKKLKGISFNYINKWNTLHPNELFQGQNNSELSCITTLGINRFNGNEYLQLMINKMELD